MAGGKGRPVSEHSVSYYMARVVDLPPLVAQAAFDARLQRSRTLRHQAESWIGGRLELNGRPRSSSGAGSMPYRVMPGILYSGLRWHRVELELAPWSSRLVQLGLRPCGGRMRRLPPDSILSAGHDVLAHLDAEMADWAVAPLADSYTRSPVPSGRDGRVWSTDEEWVG